jgi:hypothetical protein
MIKSSVLEADDGVSVGKVQDESEITIHRGRRQRALGCYIHAGYHKVRVDQTSNFIVMATNTPGMTDMMARVLAQLSTATFGLSTPTSCLSTATSWKRSTSRLFMAIHVERSLHKPANTPPDHNKGTMPAKFWNFTYLTQLSTLTALLATNHEFIVQNPHPVRGPG